MTLLCFPTTQINSRLHKSDIDRNFKIRTVSCELCKSTTDMAGDSMFNILSQRSEIICLHRKELTMQKREKQRASYSLERASIIMTNLCQGIKPI
uniref:Uncharacterized protein n=1 Tax=Arundo donax TaxID=35708 RepID=A0A0A8XZY2_ARUDO